ncbi:MAG: protease modulator HflC [Chitinivibrionales bacterium]|nr:protease modulator HflC [Chitinivibrionales bacterium]
MKRILLIIVAIAAVWALRTGLYVVDETQQVIITRFGEAIGEAVTEPGLHMTIPFVHKTTYFQKNLLEWDGDPGQIPTQDKTFIWVDVFARWRIVEPLLFFEKVNNETSAHKKLDDIIDAAVRNLVTSNNLRETVRSTNRTLRSSEDLENRPVAGAARDTADTGGVEITEVDSLVEENSTEKVIDLGRAQMAIEIAKQAQPKLEEFGIELVDVRFKRINYVEKVLKNVYKRMIAERKQIAERFRSEGRGEAQRIAGEKEKELKRIYSGAYEKAQVIKGEADAEAAKIYAAAYNRDPEFYSFIKTMDLYKESFDSTSSAVFSTKSDFLKYLKDYSGRK